MVMFIMIFQHLIKIHIGLESRKKKCEPVYDVENDKEYWQDHNSKFLNFLGLGVVLPPYKRSHNSKLNQSYEYEKDTCDHPNVEHAHITDLK